MFNLADYANINAATIAAQEEMEKDSNANIFTKFNTGFVAVFKMYASSKALKPWTNSPAHAVSTPQFQRLMVWASSHLSSFLAKWVIF